MIVYRYLCEDEYKNIMNLEFDKVGGVYEPKGASNTFHYKRDKRYLHFFKNPDDMEIMQNFYLKDGKNYYFCSFDIPTLKLITRMGSGYYTARGYDLDYDTKREFAIPVDEFNPKWIRDAILDEKKFEINQKFNDKNNQNESNTDANEKSFE